MTFLETAFAWLAAGKPPHWWTIAKMIFLFAPLLMLSVANALTKHYADVDRAKRVSRALLFFVDIFSFFASKGSPDVLKLPGVPSAPPAESPLPPLRDKDDRDPPGTGGSVVRIVGAALLALGLAACAGTPATKARKVVTFADIFNTGAARAGKISVKACAASSVAIKHEKPRALDALAKCDALQATFERVVGPTSDAADSAAASIDASEAIGSQDYAAAIKALKDAVREALEALQAAGVKLPPEVLAAAKAVLNG